MVLVLHGDHLRAAIALDEGVFPEVGATILAPSRTGHGRTPVATGGSSVGFADALRDLCAHPGVSRLSAGVGVSAGARPPWHRRPAT